MLGSRGALILVVQAKAVVLEVARAMVKERAKRIVVAILMESVAHGS